MTWNRREFLQAAAVGLSTGLLERASDAQAADPTIRAVAFDGFVIFDPRPVFALAERLFPGKGAELSSAWRTRQFEYQWLCALSRRYVDFEQATEGALVYAANLLKLDLTAENRAQLMRAYLELRAWPDVLPALRKMRDLGIRLAVLSNATPRILEAGIDNSGLQSLFDHVISTHTIHTYKPDPRAYQMGIDAFELPRNQIAFAAFGGWDAAGAKWFGYPTFWVNRMSLPVEELDARPDAIVATAGELIALIRP
jgi:2-haloacid dehalogenase